MGSIPGYSSFAVNVFMVQRALKLWKTIWNVDDQRVSTFKLGIGAPQLSSVLICGYKSRLSTGTLKQLSIDHILSIFPLIKLWLFLTARFTTWAMYRTRNSSNGWFLSQHSFLRRPQSFATLLVTSEPLMAVMDCTLERIFHDPSISYRSAQVLAPVCGIMNLSGANIVLLMRHLPSIQCTATAKFPRKTLLDQASAERLVLLRIFWSNYFILAQNPSYMLITRRCTVCRLGTETVWLAAQIISMIFLFSAFEYVWDDETIHYKNFVRTVTVAWLWDE